MTIHDLNSQSYEQFLVYKWLRASKLEPTSNTINVYEFQACEEFDLISFGHLFHMTLNRLLVDMCPWSSVFLSRYYSHLSKTVDVNLLFFIFCLNNFLNMVLIDSEINGSHNSYLIGKVLARILVVQSSESHRIILLILF